MTAFNGSRDHYEVPLAVHELGLLERHVSDVYLPDALRAPAARFFPRALRRHRDGLPSRKVTGVAGALYPQLTSLMRHKTKAPRAYESIDRRLSLAAAQIAMRTGSDLFLHSGYALWAFEQNAARCRWLYQFHPHPRAVYDILRADLDSHPEVRHSFEHEIDSQDPLLSSPALMNEWQLADHIFCASAFTARSLAAQGCDAHRLHVVPYGSFAARPISDQATRPTRSAFLFVGQGVQRKGLHHLLKAWKMAALGASELHIVSRRCDPGLAPLLNQPGVHYHANATDAQRDHLYRTCDVFVMPSLVEGFGLVYLEALAAGLYCIGSSNTGLPDLAPSSEVAAIGQAGDILGLAAMLTHAHTLQREGGLSKAGISQFANRRSWVDHRNDLKRDITQLIR